MTLDLLHADAVTDGEPGRASSPSGGTRQHPARGARLPRARAQQTRGIDRPNFVKPETAHPAFDKALPPARRRAAHGAGRSRDHARSTSTRSPSYIDDEHDRDRRLGVQLRLRHHRPDRRAVRPRARARRRPARRRLPRRVHPPVRPGARLRHPGRSTSASRASRRISADTHKYGYGVQGHVGARCSATRRCATASTSS